MTTGPSRAFLPLLAILPAMLALAPGCGSVLPPSSSMVEEPSGPEWFADVTRDMGLDFVHDAGPIPTGNHFMPQIMGSGCALFDCDGDGRLDIFLIQNGGPESRSTNRLYRQGADGKFTDATAGSGLDVAGYGMGVAAGDVNNDGLPDLCVTAYGSTRLFVNQGQGRFRDVTKEAGLDNPLWGTSAAFFDYDRDGWLDLVIANYVAYDPTKPCRYTGGRPDYCHPNAFPGSVAKLYHNLGRTSQGAAARFEDVTVRSGLARRPGPGLGVVCADFTEDGWPDIFVANDSQPNHLWINQRDGTFTEEAAARGAAYNGLGQTQANMGIALGDADGDALLDLFVTHLTEETHTLWQQQKPGYFRDRTGAMGLGSTRWRGTGFGTVFADLDQDGKLDLAVVNGRVARGSAAVVKPGAPFWAAYEERNQMFTGTDGKFLDISPQNRAFCGGAAIGRGLASGDIDGDGALDLLVSNLAGPARVYRNVAPERGRWLLIRATDPALGGRDAYGALVTIRAGEQRWRALLHPNTSYCSSNDPRVHFGLGRLTRIDEVRVLWPDGNEETFPAQETNRIVEIRKGEGKKG
jgi:hypothetical protein